MNQHKSSANPPRWACVLLWLSTCSLLFILYRAAYSAYSAPQEPAAQTAAADSPADSDSSPTDLIPTTDPGDPPAASDTHPPEYCGVWYDTAGDTICQVLYVNEDGTYTVDTSRLQPAPADSLQDMGVKIDRQSGTWKAAGDLLYFEPPIPGWRQVEGLPEVPRNAMLDGSIIRPPGSMYFPGAAPQGTLRRRPGTPIPNDASSAFFRWPSYTPYYLPDAYALYRKSGYAPVELMGCPQPIPAESSDTIEYH